MTWVLVTVGPDLKRLNFVQTLTPPKQLWVNLCDYETKQQGEKTEN